MKRMTILTLAVVLVAIWGSQSLLQPFLEMIQREANRSPSMPPAVLSFLQHSTLYVLAGIVTAILLFMEYRITEERRRFVGQIVALAGWVAVFCGYFYLLFVPIWPMGKIERQVPNQVPENIGTNAPNSQH